MATRYAVHGTRASGLVVDPSGSQPAYTRGDAANQTSKELKSHQQCVAGKMIDKSGSRKDIRKAFKKATKSC